jgi:PilZ domain
MGILRRMDRRREGRTEVELHLMVWGVDTKGERFLQEATARDISMSGALLTGLDADLRSGDIVGIMCGKRKARFRVVWVRYDETGDKMRVAVHRIDSDECPWRDLLSEDAKPPADDEASAEL